MKTVTKMPFPVYEALHSNKIPNYLPKTTRWTRPPKPQKQQQPKTTPSYAKQVQTRKPMIRTKAPQTTTARQRKQQKPTKPTRTYDQNQHEKLNTILLAYKSSRADNEDIVDTWLQSLMSDLTTKAAKTVVTRPKAVVTRPVMILK